MVFLTVSSTEVTNIPQSDLDTFQEWEGTCDVEFDPVTCQVLYITRSSLSQYTTHGQALVAVDSAQYLGVTLTQELN